MVIVNSSTNAPFSIVPVDLGTNPKKSIKVTVLQLSASYSEGNVSKKLEKKFLNQIVDVMPIADLIVCTELTVPRRLIDDLTELCNNSKSILVGGLTRGSHRENEVGIWTPKGFYQQRKIYPAPIEGNIPTGDSVYLFYNTFIGNFACLICYEFTDTVIPLRLRGVLDLLIVPTYNSSVTTFHSAAEAYTYLTYCYILLCNVAPPGGSAIYGPMKRDKCIQSWGGIMPIIRHAPLDLEGLQEMTSDIGQSSSSDYFLKLPAGYQRSSIQELQEQLSPQKKVLLVSPDRYLPNISEVDISDSFRPVEQNQFRTFLDDDCKVIYGISGTTSSETHRLLQKFVQIAKADYADVFTPVFIRTDVGGLEDQLNEFQSKPPYPGILGNRPCSIF